MNNPINEVLKKRKRRDLLMGLLVKMKIYTIHEPYGLMADPMCG